METVKLKHVHKVRRRTRAGFETHYYHRITREKLPAGRDRRAARVIEINASLGGPSDKSEPREAKRAGTFADLVARYRASQKFQERSPATRKDYLPHLEAIVATWGPLSVRGFKRKHAYAMQEGLADTPRAANKRLTILSRLINFGIDKDEDVFGATNPVTRFERLRTGAGYVPWPEHVIDKFDAAAYPELRAVAIAGLLNTGQRTSDVVAMPWAHYDGSGIEVVQQKTGERLWVPASAEFKAIVDKLPRRGTVIFTTKTGRAWGPQNIYAEIRKVLRAIGCEGYTPPRPAVSRRGAAEGSGLFVGRHRRRARPPHDQSGQTIRRAQTPRGNVGQESRNHANDGNNGNT